MMAELAAAYKSGCQKTRVITEFWGEHNLYCANCASPKLKRLKNNEQTVDYCCPVCSFQYQLKGQQAKIGNSIPDGAYDPMVRAIRNDKTPNFLFMQYDLSTWSVMNLLLVPHFAFPLSAIIKRNPTLPKGRSKPWIGCTISLARIPTDARIHIVKAGTPTAADEVRDQFKRIKPLKALPVEKRGWMLDVLTAVRSLGKQEFSNQDVYALVPHFEKLHPHNRHITDKIRQQLQDLCRANLLSHVGRGVWRLS